MRNLVTIQKIKEINPIKDADRIEVATILGWKCVVKKDEFKVGDFCIYFEIDSFLPEIPMFEFLRSSSFKKTDWQGNGFRIRTQKLRGQISQGLLLPLSALNEIKNTFTDRKISIEEGEDVTDIFGVAKYDPPEFDTGVGTVKAPLQYGIYKTDETRIQSCPDILKEFYGKPYYITSKMDGTSVTMYLKDGKFGITGHQKEFILDENCLYYKWAIKNNIEEKLRSLNKNLAFQGEFCGPGIQNNRCGLKDYDWFVFNIQDLNTHNFLSFNEFKKICDELKIITVPIDEIGESFNYSEDELLEKADGSYFTGKRREGIVVRPQIEEHSNVLNGRLSFKVLNNKYLLKNDL